MPTTLPARRRRPTHGFAPQAPTGPHFNVRRRVELGFIRTRSRPCTGTSFGDSDKGQRDVVVAASLHGCLPEAEGGSIVLGLVE
jgi:hypothetical protein